MKPPPFLLGAALLFWGWQTDHLTAGAIMGAVLESAQWIKVRWEFTDQDFRRIWVFCALLLLGAAVYAFTSNGGPADLRDLLQNPGSQAQRAAALASARAVAVWLRLFPVAFFLFIAAQTYNAREGIPPETISLLMRWRWQKAQKLGPQRPTTPNVNVSFPYFAACLFAAGFRLGDDSTFFWGLCVLVGWALWSQRARRFNVVVWAGAAVAAVLLGYASQFGISRLYRVLEAYSPQWTPRFTRGGTNPDESKTHLGQIGRLKLSSRIVVRLESKDGSKVPALLHEASYESYRRRVWTSEVPKDRYEPVYEETNHTSWRLLPDKTNSAAVNIACSLPGGYGLLPLPAGAGRLDNLSAFILQKSPLGTVLAQGPGLVIFDALYGPGEMIDAPGNDKADLAVPEEEIQALDQVIAELQLQPRNRKQALRVLSGLFQEQGKFRYSVWQPGNRPRGSNETTISRFLLQTHSGHCEYFATATVLLLRRLEIPARYAVGFAVHEASGSKYVIRERDAHAWCKVWNENARVWQDIDTTPADWVAVEASRASPMQALLDLWWRIEFEFSKFRWGQTHLRQYLMWTLAPVLVLLLYQIIFRSRRQRRKRPSSKSADGSAWPGLDSEFYLLERKLTERGAARAPGEPLSTWLGRTLADPALVEARGSLEGLLRLHYRYRFDPHGLAPTDREMLRRRTKACLVAVGSAKPASHQDPTPASPVR